MSKKKITLVLPAYNERENISPFIMEAHEKGLMEFLERIIVVDDDSPDGTSEYIKNTNFPLEVLALHRIGRQGLSSAVVEGIMLADTEYVAVMDADGQHSPADLKKMCQILESNPDTDLIIGSRFYENGMPESHQGWRLKISNMGNTIANTLVKRQISDPMTGFFVMRRNLFLTHAQKIHSSGFKILFEILYSLRNSNVNIREMQIDFRKRHAGESKLDAAVLLLFADQVGNMLTKGMIPEKFTSFVLVGGTGVIVHMCMLYMILQNKISFVLAQTLATLVAIVWNYTFNNLLTFRRNRKRGADYFKGLFLFTLFCGIGVLANIGVATAINNSGMTWWISGIAGIFISTVFNFSISKMIIWKK